MKTNECYLPLLPLERFTFSGGALSAFESDLRDRPFDGHYDFIGRLWNDACDVGIAIRSHHTGRVERFYLERTEERDGNLLAWYFKPVDPKCRVREVIIFND